MRPPRLLGPADLLVAGCVAFLAVLAWRSDPGAPGDRAVVYLDGRPVAWWNLEGPVRDDSVPGALGEVVVRHGGGEVRIVRSPCPHQLCVRAGAARAVHAQLACVPSHVVVVVEGDRVGEGLDAVP